MDESSTNMAMIVPPELVIQMAMELTTLAALKNFTRAAPYFSQVLELNQFVICEVVVLKDFGPLLWDYAYNLLVQQGRLQKIAEPDIITPFETMSLTNEKEPKKEGEQAKVSLDRLGVLAGGTRIGIVEAIELEAYKRRLEEWKVVWVKEHYLTPNPYPWLTLRDSAFDISHLGTMTEHDHFRVERAFYRFWLMVMARIPEEIKHYKEWEATDEPREDRYEVWCRENVLTMAECRLEWKQIHMMWNWLKVVPELALKDGAEELYELFEISEFYYQVSRNPADIFPKSSAGGKFGFPGTWVDRDGDWGRDSIFKSVERLRGYFSVDLNLSLYCYA